MVATLLSAMALSAALPAQTLLVAVMSDEAQVSPVGEIRIVKRVDLADNADVPEAEREVRVFLRNEQTGEEEVCHTAKICVGPNGPVYVTSEPGTEVHKVVLVGANDAPPPPKVWIGVRITAVPEPLAAHIGEFGVMVSNVIVGSPADQAGLEQYDVIVAFDGQDMDSPTNLTEAVAATEAGQPVKLKIIRGGQPRTVKLAPAERAPDQEYELKYEEPEEVLLHDDVALRGLRLLQPGQGEHEWIIEKLGPLQGLPDVLKELEDFQIDLDVELEGIEDLLDAHGMGGDVDVRVFTQPGQGFSWRTNADSEASMQIKIKMEDEGRSLVIETGSDGVIHVSRTDAGGNETSATYDSAEELEKADPDAYEVYREHVPGGGLSWLTVTPSQEKAYQLQQQFQIDVERKLKEAMEDARAAAEDAEQRAQREVRAARRAYRTARESDEARAGSGGDDEALGVRIAADGSIAVYARDEQGNVQKYAFTNKEAFQAAEPELYQKFKDLLE